MLQLNRLALLAALSVGGVLSLADASPTFAKADAGDPGVVEDGGLLDPAAPAPNFRLEGSYVVKGSGIERSSIDPGHIAKGHQGLTGSLHADGEGHATFVFYADQITTTWGISDGFATTKDCTYSEGNPMAHTGSLLCYAENSIVKLVFSVRYTITLSGEKVVASGVLFHYTKTADDGYYLTQTSDLTVELEREDL
jgi:hypothetical protein